MSVEAAGRTAAVHLLLSHNSVITGFFLHSVELLDKLGCI